MEYEILTHSDPSSLEKMVSRKIKDGWKPTGGIAINSYEDSNGHTDSWVAQAMIKD